MSKLRWWVAAWFALVIPCVGATAFGTAASGAKDKQTRLLELRARKAGDARFQLPRKWKVLIAEEGEVTQGRPYLHLQHTDADGEIG